MFGDERIEHANIFVAVVANIVSRRAAMPKGAIQTDVAQIKLINTLKNCHFDHRGKSALHRLKARSRFLLATEMTVIVSCAYHFKSHSMPDVHFVSVDDTVSNRIRMFENRAST